MAKQKRQNLIEREKNKKVGSISKLQLYSCYAASLLIVVLCIVEALKPETQASGNATTYYFLAVLGVAFSIYITVRNNAAKKKDVPTGKRLK
jgi:predicted membrane chloride channel (bestrophin family)